MNILVSSAGRRSALIQLIKQEAARHGGRVFAIDAGDWSSAARVAHRWTKVPHCTSPEFIPCVLDFCRAHDIRLLIPTIDTELAIYAPVREEFVRAGVQISASGPETIAIASDKLKTCEFLRAKRLPVVRHFDLESLPDAAKLPYPVVIKPRFGSASQGVQVAEDPEEFAFYYKRTPHPIVQERARGREFTVNFFVARDQYCVTAVPHARIATRGGEVSQAVTDRQPELIHVAQQLAQQLPDAWGPLCYQAFLSDNGAIQIIEINARFGGGYPLAHAAGANFIRWLIDDRLGRPVPTSLTNWEDGLAMSRWDDAVFWSVPKARQRAA